MKNRWFLLFFLILAVLMTLTNKKALSQMRSDDVFSSRTNPDCSYHPDNDNDTLWSAGWVKLKYEEYIKRIIKINHYDEKQKDSLLDVVKKYKDEKQKKLINRRFCAIEDLEYIASKRQIPDIEQIMLTDSDIFMRKACASVLENVKSTESIPALIEASKNEKHIHVRLQIGLSLASLGEKTYSFETLKSVWNNEGDKMLCNDGFIDINTPDAINFLRTEMNYSNPYVALDAMACLAELGYKDEVLPVIKMFLHNDNAEISKMAMKVIVYFNIAGKNSFALIKSLTNDDNKDIQNASRDIIQRYFPNTSINIKY